MDPITTGITAAAVLEVVKAAAAYLATTKAAETAGDILAKAGAEAVVGAGKSAWERLRKAVGGGGDDARKAETALANLDSDPADEDYQNKLAKELTALAATDPGLRDLLVELTAQMTAPGGAVVINAPVKGIVSGTNFGTQTYNESGAGQDGSR